MKQFKLLTPGPLTTSEGVREQMMYDRCTWDDEYKAVTQKIRKQLLQIAKVSEEEYTAVLMQGSGSFGVEATLGTVVGKCGKCLIVVNGAYGERMVQMAKRMGMSHEVYRTDCSCPPDANDISRILGEDSSISHVAMVHCETTTGILNPIDQVARACKERGVIFILDAMSSFGGVCIDVKELGIDYLVSSANKCIQGVPGFSFVIARRDRLSECEGRSSSLTLDIYDQWKVMEVDGKWRYTSPTHVVAAFSKALDELEQEGGVQAREQRYSANNSLLRKTLEQLGIKAYIDEKIQSPVITTFLFPSDDFDFSDFYEYVKDRGFILYPGKLTDEDTFRVGNIGEIYEGDIIELFKIIKDYMGGRYDG